jgi:Fe-S-cluster-containing dehydrogenase component
MRCYYTIILLYCYKIILEVFVIKYLKTHDDRCVGCQNCLAACSKAYAKEENPAKARIQLINKGQSRFRLIVCDQECRKCVLECPVQAIQVNSQGVVTIDKNLCVGCLACVAVCPVGAMCFYPGESLPFKCIACGICVKTCFKDALEIAEKPESEASKFPFENAAKVNYKRGK